MTVALRRPGSVSSWRHVRAIVSLPLTNTVLIPAAIAAATDGIGTGLPFRVALPSAVRLGLGIGLLAAGVALVAGAIALFVRLGHGTLAPWDPPRTLVVAGLYRHSRNPMKLGLFATLLGEAVVLGSGPLLVWFTIFAAANVLYVRLSEEPALAARFGRRYAEYCRHVPRWMPRRKPWVDRWAGPCAADECGEGSGR
jgi:protein-S-isoprenylcysteine O-methyltransferase Ste14